MKRLFLFLILAVVTVFGLVIGLGLVVEDNPVATAVDDVFGAGTFSDIALVYVLPFLFYLSLAIVLLLLWQTLLVRLAKTVSATTVNTLQVVGRLIIIPFSIVAFLNSYPIFQGTLLGVAALFGTAVGFASTNTIGNFLAGVYILLIRPFSIGDYVIFPGLGAEGRIREITINFTKIEGVNGNITLFTNNSLLNQQIINTRIERRITNQKGKEVVTTVVLYPLKWGVPVGESFNAAVKALEKLAADFDKEVVEPISWFVLSRDKWERLYQVSIVVEQGKDLLPLLPKFLTALAAEYERTKAL